MTTIDELVNKIKTDMKYMPEWYDNKVMDILLSRDWFVDEECIAEVLSFADQNAWDWIYANRQKYSTRIRMLIEPNDYIGSIKKPNACVVDLTDAMMEKIANDHRKKRDAEFEKDWIEHSRSIPDRRFEDVDSILDDAWDNFCKARDILTKYLEKPTVKKYVSPNKRDKSIYDSKQVELENEVRKLENEYDVAQKKVDEADTLYWDIRKNEFRKNWVSTL